MLPSSMEGTDAASWPAGSWACASDVISPLVLISIIDAHPPAPVDEPIMPMPFTLAVAAMVIALRVPVGAAGPGPLELGTLDGGVPHADIEMAHAASRQAARVRAPREVMDVTNNLHFREVDLAEPEYRNAFHRDQPIGSSVGKELASGCGRSRSPLYLSPA